MAIGRPTVITEPVVRKLEECFAKAWSVADACFEAKISESTYYDQMKANKIFSERMRYAQGNLIRLSKQTLVQAVPNNPQLAAWTLERKAKNEGFAPRTELTGAEGVPLGYAYTSDVLDKPEEPKQLLDGQVTNEG